MKRRIIAGVRLPLAWVFLLCAAGAADPPSFRLPDVARPVRYDLELTIVPRQAAFRGAAAIDVVLNGPAQSLWLNARDLVVDEARIRTNGQTLRARSTVSGEFLGLEWDSPVNGPARIEIAYRGEMKGGRNTGLYRRRAGEHWYAFTAFTPIEARSAFPCFDEPGYKTPWRIVLNVPPTDVAVSNAGMASERKGAGGLKRVEFAETKPLPSEVVAFAVGPFDIVDDGVAGSGRVPVRILTPRGRAAEAEGAKGVAARLLAHLETYTGIPYPWDKLDHVAALGMPFGAVENPGLIVYRDSGLLAKEPSSIAEHRYRVTGLMAHELAHQWFGNLVTQAWWDDVWLSEGFATWLGVKAADLELPDFLRGIKAATERAEIMRTDASQRTRPVRMAVNSRADMAGVYSQFVYLKAAAVLRMIEDWIGPQAFQQGVREYLTRHAYGTATTGDFAAAMRSGSGVDVSGVLNSYLNETGFPVIRIDCERGSAIVSGRGPWTTPVCAKADGLARACVLVSSESATVSKGGQCPAWWWPNRNGAGYFAAETAPAALAAVVDGAWTELNTPERLTFVEDLQAAVTAKRIDSETVRKALPRMARDRDPNVVGAAYRLLLSLIAATPPAERGRFDDTLNDMLGSRRR